MRLLDEYRREFGEAYSTVVRAIREQLGVEPSGRPAKSTDSIVEKLRRESLRLTQMQDIAGYRIVVENLEAQDHAVAAVSRAFPKASVIDRREKPSYGYRAVHVIVDVPGLPVEVQIRTKLQHLWAESSEKISELSEWIGIDPPIKYGGGPEDIQKLLVELSEGVHRIEPLEKGAVREGEIRVTQGGKRRLAERLSELITGVDALRRKE